MLGKSEDTILGKKECNFFWFDRLTILGEVERLIGILLEGDIMSGKDKKLNRRQFFKVAGGAGAASILASQKGLAEVADPNAAKEEVKPAYPQIGKRVLGKTGKEVPELGLGLMFNVEENQLILHKSLEWGVNYWDTAWGDANGTSELGIGKFFKRQPEKRKDVFLVSKASRTDNAAEVEERLQESLQRMNVSYIDVYYLHNIESTERLNNELRDWAKSAKDRGLIGGFGFTSHGNITECLNFASKLEWIDVIMHSYNFRLMQDKELNAAMDACHKAGIGLVAMKTQGQKQKSFDTDADKQIVEYFLSRGLTEGQAKIKAVLGDDRISCACVGMKSVSVLTSNVAGVLDEGKLADGDVAALLNYAEQTCDGYCAGCSTICRDAVGMGYVSDVMRYLMYYNSYGDKERAKELFNEIPADVRGKLARMDYSKAERMCPQGLAIGELMKEAVSKLS